MFIGREKELAELERRYAQPGFQFPVVYGRRRIGKTRLLREFLRDKRSVYFMATEQSGHVLLRLFTEAIREQLPGELPAYIGAFGGFEDLFKFIGEISASKRLVLAIDEYPRLAKACPEISSVLQKFIDLSWNKTQLYLILCGSSMSFMESQVLGEKSPLYGRRTGQLKLLPLPYYEAVRFFTGWSAEDQLMGYGICGGIPKYLEIFSACPSLREAILSEFLCPGGHLIEEPGNLLKQELREPAVYNSILSSIADGATRLSEIAQSAGIAYAKLGFYIANLTDLGIIKREKPSGKGGARRSLFAFADEMFSFWYRFMPSCQNLIEMGAAQRAYEGRIAPLLPQWFGHVFEHICMDYLKFLVANGKIAVLYTDYGRWWGTNPVKKREEEIDLVLSDERHLLAGECKWRKERADLCVLKELEERAALVSLEKEVSYAIFSRAGFSPELKDLRRDDLMLADVDRLMSIVPVSEQRL